MKYIHKKRLNLYISPTSFTKFKKICVDLDISMSDQLEMLIESFLKMVIENNK